MSSAVPSLSDKFAAYLAHWRALRGSEQMPTLAQFLDNPVPTWQPWIAIYDADEDLTLRLHGTALVDFFRHDFTGVQARRIQAAGSCQYVVEEASWRLYFLKRHQQPAASINFGEQGPTDRTDGGMSAEMFQLHARQRPV